MPSYIVETGSYKLTSLRSPWYQLWEPSAKTRPCSVSLFYSILTYTITMSSSQDSSKSHKRARSVVEHPHNAVYSDSQDESAEDLSATLAQAEKRHSE